jgi:DNA invertase Pin-like site-specific DNA recombinase
MIAAYVRVSSRSQDVRSQRRAIEQCARARGDKVARWFVEKRSGATLQRPELELVRAGARRGALSKLYVFALDRLTRSGIRDTLAILEELRGAGCQVSTVADPFPLEGPAADVVVAVFAWVAQMERKRIGERISAARARVEAEGGRWGRPRRVATGGELERKMRSLVRQKKSIRAIARALKIPRSTVARTVERFP